MNPLHEFEYPADEFISHFFAIEGTRMAEKEAFYQVIREYPPGFTIQEYLARTLEYMMTFFDNEDEALDKTSKYVLIMWHVITNIDKYDQADYAIVGSNESGSLISIHLLKAVHKVAMELHNYDEDDEYDIDLILRLADEFKAQ